MSDNSIKKGIQRAHERVSGGYGLIPPNYSQPSASSYDMWNFDRHVIRPLTQFIHDYVNSRNLDTIRLLDAGCGNGQIAAVYASLGVGHITAVDFSPGMLIAFETRFKSAGMDTRYHRVLADLENLDAMRSSMFDIINFFGVIEHLDHPDAAIGHLLRLLKPGGILLLGVPRLWSFANLTYYLFGIPPSRWGQPHSMTSYFAYREKYAYYRYYTPGQVLSFMSASGIPFTLVQRTPFAFSHMDGIAGYWQKWLGRKGDSGYRWLDQIEHMLMKIGVIPGGEWWTIRRK